MPPGTAPTGTLAEPGIGATLGKAEPTGRLIEPIPTGVGLAVGVEGVGWTTPGSGLASGATNGGWLGPPAWTRNVTPVTAGGWAMSDAG